MRAHLFISALFAASLFGGAALADRPGDDGVGRTSRIPVREMHVREVRDPAQREVRSHQMREPRVRDPQVTERLRSRGDMVDRSSSRAATKSAAARTQREAASRTIRPLEAKKNAVINCAPNDEACAPGARSARAVAKASETAAQKAESNRQRAEIQKMVEKVRSERLKAIVLQKMCAKQGNLCAQNL